MHTAQAILTSLFITFSSASPLPKDQIEIRQPNILCNSPSLQLFPECWDQLGAPSRIDEFWVNQRANCTAMQKGFGSCFQTYHNINNQNCDTLGPSLCTLPDNLASYEPVDAYIIWNIFALWQWFNSIWMAIENASNNVGPTVGKIVSLLNPPEDHNVAQNELLTALTAALSFLKLPSETGIFLHVLLTPALQQAPLVIKTFFYPVTGNTQSQVNQISDISAALSNVTVEYQKSFTQGLNAIINDKENFKGLAANGGFSTNATSLQVQTDGLFKSLITYIISECFKANGIVITAARDTNPHELQYNGTFKLSQSISCDYYDAYGVCSAWWYNSQTNTAYGFDKVTQGYTNYYAAMQTLFGNGWTTGLDLIQGAVDCANDGGGGPYIDPNTLATRCMSSIQVCYWDMSCRLDAGNDGCEFENCPAQSTFPASCGGNTAYGGSWDYTAKLPAAYLGPWLTRANGDEYHTCR
ncbi:MAG: hypothetical protein M1836_005259 [Candelina mexicana]|nr:MAG: hypothetical protein M1836_005259 [Candelina mexicana]